jgi:hypothetical protein
LSLLCILALPLLHLSFCVSLARCGLIFPHMVGRYNCFVAALRRRGHEALSRLRLPPHPLDFHTSLFGNFAFLSLRAVVRRKSASASHRSPNPHHFDLGHSQSYSTSSHSHPSRQITYRILYPSCTLITVRQLAPAFSALLFLLQYSS